MDFHVSLSGRGDLSARIYRQLHQAIIDGRLRPGERLPPTRDLARQLEVARNTVSVAYDRLTAEGFLVGRVGAGTYVCANPPGQALHRPAAESSIRTRSVWQGLTAGAAAGPPPPFNFGVGIPDATRFPMTEWRGQVTRQLRETTPETANYGDPAGMASLRTEIARHVGLSRSVLITADDVVVTGGTQQALDLVGRLLIEPGDVVAVEEPGYPPARDLFRSLGATVVGVPVDDEGLVVTALPAEARLVYTTPSHQFPLGPPMSLDRRTSLLAWAHRTDAVVIEDDYDSEFRFADRPLEPLHSLDRGDRVLYVGSFSKTMLPMLRLGFVVAPSSLRPALATAKHLTDRHTDLVTQGAMAGFMASGAFVRHLRRSTREYAARRALILDILTHDFTDRLEVVPGAAGLHLAAWLRTPTDVNALVSRAATAGVAVENLAAYHLNDNGRPGLVIGYGAIETSHIEEGLRRLASAW